jgi:hypothetical protein
MVEHMPSKQEAPSSNLSIALPPKKIMPSSFLKNLNQFIFIGNSLELFLCVPC